jgi:hypothetical protein
MSDRVLDAVAELRDIPYCAEKGGYYTHSMLMF